MSKQQTPRALPDYAAKAVLRNIKGSPQKAGLVLELIRRIPVERALAELQFSRKKMAVDARKLLLSAIANAENNHQLNVDDLVVAEAFSDKSVTMKRFRARARGRAAKILKPRCHITIIVAEKAKLPLTKHEKKDAIKSEAMAIRRAERKAAAKPTQTDKKAS